MSKKANQILAEAVLLACGHRMRIPDTVTHGVAHDGPLVARIESFHQHLDDIKQRADTAARENIGPDFDIAEVLNRPINSLVDAATVLKTGLNDADDRAALLQDCATAAENAMKANRTEAAKIRRKVEKGLNDAGYTPEYAPVNGVRHAGGQHNAIKFQRLVNNSPMMIDFEDVYRRHDAAARMAHEQLRDIEPLKGDIMAAINRLTELHLAVV